MVIHILLTIKPIKYSEFFKQTYESQNKNINEGQYILEELFKVKINIFIPP